MKENLNYKVKINVPNAIELISETFDGVLDYMSSEMLVFGGALRDIIAGFGLHYDLDIATSQPEGERFVHCLETSSKWIEECVVTQYKERDKITKNDTLDIILPHSIGNGMLDLDKNISYITKPMNSNYNNGIQNVRTFINSSGRKLQIIMSKSDLFTLEETSPTFIVETVDFICCGIIMDMNGNVYEIIEGAKDDCIKKILRINKNANIEFDNLNKRIKKFVARGWKSEINLAKIKYKQARLRGNIEKKGVGNLKEQSGCIYKHLLLDGKTQILINTSKMQTFKRCSLNKYIELLHDIFKIYGLSAQASVCAIYLFYNSRNQAIISVTNKNAHTITTLRHALLVQEQYLLSNQPHKIKMPKLRKKGHFYHDMGKSLNYSQNHETGYPPSYEVKSDMYTFSYSYGKDSYLSEIDEFKSVIKEKIMRTRLMSKEESIREEEPIRGEKSIRKNKMSVTLKFIEEPIITDTIPVNNKTKPESMKSCNDLETTKSNANHGTSAGGMTTADLVGGKVGKTIDFDAGDDGINLEFVEMEVNQNKMSSLAEITTKNSAKFAATLITPILPKNTKDINAYRGDKII